MVTLVISDNFKIIDLSDEEVRKLNDIHKSHSFRVCKPQWTGWGALGFPDQ
jgi:glycerol 2-dehydrogenase (NADP+)